MVKIIFIILISLPSYCYSQNMSEEEIRRNIINSNNLLLKNPNDLIQLKVRGTSYLMLKEFNRALSDFNAAIMIERDRDVYFSIGMCYEGLGDSNSGIKYYSLAIEVDNNYYEAYINRGILNRNVNNFKEAIKDFEMGKELKGETFQVCLNLGSTYLEMNQFEKSERFLKKAADMSKTNIFVNFYLAKLYMKMNDKVNSCKYFSSLNDLSKNFKPNDINSLRNYCK